MWSNLYGERREFILCGESEELARERQRDCACRALGVSLSEINALASQRIDPQAGNAEPRRTSRLMAYGERCPT